MPIFHGPMSLDVFQPRCLWKIRWPRNWSKALRRRGGSAAQTVRRTWSQKKPWEKSHQKYNIYIYGKYIWEFYGKYLWTNSICFFGGKLTLRPCQIGFGRLVSTKSRWFSGSMLIYWRVIYIYIGIMWNSMVKMLGTSINSFVNVEISDIFQDHSIAIIHSNPIPLLY